MKIDRSRGQAQEWVILKLDNARPSNYNITSAKSYFGIF